jgi:hypothetical protein
MDTSSSDVESGAPEARGPASSASSASKGSRTAIEWIGLAALAVTVLIAGAFVGLLGPLLAVSCSGCQDGIRSPLRFEEALIAVAFVAVPLTSLGTVVGIFAARRGALAGGIGLCALVLLFVAQQILGQLTG